MVLGGAGWDRKESPESNLHVCVKDDTKIVLYNMGRCTKKEEEENQDCNSCTILLFDKNI